MEEKLPDVTDTVFAAWEELTHNVSVSMVLFKISGMLVTVLYLPVQVLNLLVLFSKQKKEALQAEDGRSFPSSLWIIDTGIKDPLFLTVCCVTCLSPG